jgi:hypothetical protein
MQVTFEEIFFNNIDGFNWIQHILYFWKHILHKLKKMWYTGLQQTQDMLET